MAVRKRPSRGERTRGTADSEMSQAGAQTGGTQAGAGGESRQAVTGSENIADIGQAESYILNLKHLVAQELDRVQFDFSMHQRHSRNAEDFDQTMRTLTSRALNASVDITTRLQNLAVSHDHRVKAFQEGEIARTVRHSDLAIDRQWNIDEVAALVAKTPVFQDAIAGAVATAVANSLNKKS